MTDGDQGGQDGSRPQPPERCPDCGTTDPTDFELVVEDVTDTVQERQGWRCARSDCGWQGQQPWTCGSTDTTAGDPCGQHVAEPQLTCYLHGEDGSVPDGTGAPAGNDHAAGADGAGAPEGNMNAMQGGTHMALQRRLEAFDQDQKELFRAYADDFAGKVENRTAAWELAAAAVLLQTVEERLLDQLWDEIPLTTDDGQHIMDPETGEPVEIKKLRDRDMKAYTDLLREIRLGKKDEGVISDENDQGVAGHPNRQRAWNDPDPEDVQAVTDGGGDD